MTDPGGTPGRTGRWTPDALDALARRVRESPEVVRLHAGFSGEIAAYLPGHRVPGLRLLDDDRVEVHVVMSVHSTVDRVEAAVLEAAGDDRSLVDLVVADVADPDLEGPDAEDAEGRDGDPTPGTPARPG